VLPVQGRHAYFFPRKKNLVVFALAARISLTSFDVPGCSFSLIVNLSLSGRSLGLITRDSSGDWTEIFPYSNKLSLMTTVNFWFLDLPLGIFLYTHITTSF